MMNSNNQLSERSKKILKSASIVFLVFGLIGFFDATYLTIEHYQGVIPPCSLTGGCETVLTSDYSSILNIPVSVLGMIYYFFVFIFAIAYIDTKKSIFLRMCASIGFFGFLASLFFVFLQLFVIKSICFYCMISAITSTVLFSAGFLVLKHDNFLGLLFRKKI